MSRVENLQNLCCLLLVQNCDINFLNFLSYTVSIGQMFSLSQHLKHKPKQVRSHSNKKGMEFRFSGEEVTCSPPAIPHCLKRRTTCNVAPHAMPHHLQHCTTRNIKPPATLHSLQNKKKAAKWPMGSGYESNPRFLGAANNFHIDSGERLKEKRKDW